MPREILTKRIENGWSNTDGRIVAIRDSNRDLRDAIKRGEAVTTHYPRDYWDVRLMSPDGSAVWDEESVNTLDEADDQAWWFADRIAAGTDHPDHEEG